MHTKAEGERGFSRKTAHPKLEKVHLCDMLPMIPWENHLISGDLQLVHLQFRMMILALLTSPCCSERQMTWYL